MSTIHLYMFMLTLACVTFATQERPLARTSLGDLRGTWRTSARGKQYAAFTSVPYAKPPVGPLRFEAPEPVGKWHGVLDVNSPAPECMSYRPSFGNSTQKLDGQEDCLYLNVYSPKLPNYEHKFPKTKHTLLPVIIYIHGGVFMYGSSKWYGAKLLMDRDVVYVSIQYRVGPLGFLSLDDPAQPGNHGLCDQVVALQWIQDHIYKFSGDPNSVTITGGSAGGASVHYHYLSPLSQGLFARGISMSGTAFNRWALTDSARKKSERLAENLGCPIDNAQLIIECLKHRPAKSIVEQVEPFMEWKDLPFSPFGPVVEEAKGEGTQPPFLPDWPIRLLEQGAFKRVPWITGVTTAEGLYPAGFFITNPEDLEILNQNFTQLIPHILDFYFTVRPEDRDDVSNRIRHHYFGNQSIEENTVPQIIKMVGDRLFVVDAQRAAELQSEYSPVYIYNFAFRGKHSLNEFMTGNDKDYGVSHADDVGFVIDVPRHPHIRNGMEKEVETLMLDLWTSFAKLGVPQSGDLCWRPVSEGGDLEMLYIDGVPPTMVNVTDLGDAKFWESLPLQEPQQTVG